MEPLRDGGLLEEIGKWGQALRVCSLIPLSVLSLCFTFVVEDVVSLLSAPAAMPTCHDGLSSLSNHKLKQSLPSISCC